MRSTLFLTGLWLAVIALMLEPELRAAAGRRLLDGRLALLRRRSELAKGRSRGDRLGRRATGYVGRAARHTFRRQPSGSLDRRLGTALMVGLGVGFIAPPLAPVAGGGVWAAGWWRTRTAAARERGAVIRELPDLVELLIMAVGSGLNVRLAVGQVAKRAPPYTARALDAVLAQVRGGARLADALESLPRLLGDPVRPLAAALIDADRYGGALLPALERVSLEVRLDRRRRAEEAVRRIPVTLLFPLVTCVLPAFALLTVAPLIASALGALRQ